MKVVFFGTPELSVLVLRALIDAPEIHVVAIVTQPDKPVGRKHELTSPPVKVVADTAGIPVWQFPTLKNPQAVAQLSSLDADAFVVFAYGKMIPDDVLSIPRLGCLNLHPSLLPAYRGPAPINAPILHGDSETGVTIMLLDSGMDTGPILAQTKVAVASDDTAESLGDRLVAIGAPLLVETLQKYSAGEIKPQAQTEEGITTTKKLDREDGLIVKGDDPTIIDRKIRAYFPWPGCYMMVKHNGQDLRVKLLPLDPHARGGSGGGSLFLVQPEGKQPMTLPEFERGYGPLF